MFNKISVFLVVLVSVSFFAFYLGDITPDDKQRGYTGAEACGMCHKKEKDGDQLGIWKNSKHANAYKTLQSEASDKLAKEKGFETKAVETEACLKCHASGYNADASLLGKKFKVEDGVQCETCHGAGDDYKSMKVMKDRAQSVANGLVVWENEEAINKMCVTCHNEESPTYKGFDFAARWAEIKHNIPEK